MGKLRDSKDEYIAANRKNKKLYHDISYITLFTSLFVCLAHF